MDIGRFDYNSGHLEVFEGGAEPSITGIMNGANADDASLASTIESSFAAKGVSMNPSFVSPLPAGGIETTPADYAAFLININKLFRRSSDSLSMLRFYRNDESDNCHNQACDRD